MLLGVYWYFGFPEGLYHFEFFSYQPGRGVPADGPAELAATVQALDPVALLAAVRALAARYPDGYLFGQTHGFLLRLELSGYHLTDYSFHLASELENVLRQHQATPTTEPLPAGTPRLRLAEPQDPTPAYRYGDDLLQAVGSSRKQHQAEVASLRLDCHLPLARKVDFLAALDALCERLGLDVLYYLDYELPGQVNLMIFFANGRQGVRGQPQRYTDTVALQTAVLAALAAHGGQTGHLGGYPAEYPRRGPHLVRMVDENFVL